MDPRRCKEQLTREPGWQSIPTGTLLAKENDMKNTLFIATIMACSLVVYGAAQAAGDVAAGKTKSAMCAGCHGTNGQGVPPNPALAGKPEADIAQALRDFRSGKRVNPVKKAITASLSEQDIENLATFYASLK